MRSHLLFLDFSGGEFLLVALVFLTFFGSKSIPGMARTIGKAVREFREAANTVQREIHESVNMDEVIKPTPPPATQPSPPTNIREQGNQPVPKVGEEPKAKTEE